MAQTRPPRPAQAPPSPEPYRHLPPSQRPSAAGPLDAIDKILDKGIVIDAWVEARLLGIPLLSLEARVVVASIETYLWYAQSIMELPPIGRGPLAGPRAMGRSAGLAFETAGEQGLLSQPAETPEPEEAMAEQAMAELPPDQFAGQAQALLERAQRIAEREAALEERERALADQAPEPEPEAAPEPEPTPPPANGGQRTARGGTRG